VKTTSEHADAIRRLLLHPTGGLIGLVDEMLSVCADHGLSIDWQLNRLRIQSTDGEWEEITDELPRKSVFRAILARVATLCNEVVPDSVSSYGGTAKLALPSHPAVVFRFEFANTPDAQEIRIATAQN
jgi:hypothetical protein